MALTNKQNVNPLDHPLIGIGDYFLRLKKPANAKHALKKVSSSPTATEIDKGNARMLIRKAEEELRNTSEAKLDGTVVSLPVNDLSPLEEAEIPMGSQDYKRILEDIRERGIQVPLVVNTDNKIICGKHRWQAAKEVGLQEVPCTMLGVTNIEELRYYALSDNLNRRQMGSREKKAIIIEILRLRKESKVRGRKKDSDKKPVKTKRDLADAPNVKLAEIMNVDEKVIRNIEKEIKDPTVPKSATTFIKPLKNFVKEDLKKQISWGKSDKADKEFSKEVSGLVGERIEFIRTQAKKGQRLIVEVVFQYEDSE